MKQLLIISVVFLSLISNLSLANKSANDKVNVERIKAEKNYIRARSLVAGIKKNKTLSKRIYSSAIGKAEKHIEIADGFMSKSREYLLAGFHGGDISEEHADQLMGILKNQKEAISKLKSSISDLHILFAKKNKKSVVKGPKREVVVKEFLGWHEKVKNIQKSESLKWTKYPATKKLWQRAVGDLGFYGSHIENLSDSILYANNREIMPQQEYDYIKQGMHRFMAFHKQLIALMEKIKAANNADLTDTQEQAEYYLRPYLSQSVFSGLPVRNTIPVLPDNPVDNLGYIPPRSMKQTLSSLSKNPSIKWIMSDKYVNQVFRAFYDRGLVHEFLKKFVNRGGRFKVEVIANKSGKEVVRLSFDGDLYIPDDQYTKDKLVVNSKLLISLLNEMFLSYNSKIVDANKDPATKTLLENTQAWLKRQSVRQSIEKVSSKRWSKFTDEIHNAKSFTEEYIATITAEAFSSHLEIWNKYYQKSRYSRITLEQANDEWTRVEKKIRSGQYAGHQINDGIKWEVQGPPPDFILTYIFALYGLGVY